MKTKPQDSKPIIKNDYQPVLVADEKPLNINGERKGNIGECCWFSILFVTEV